jgi:hypothetical protein
MTKYMVFKNQPNSGQVNAPGSREEMASEIANVVSQDRMLPNYYIAFPVEDANVSMQSLREMARFTVEITDETAALWTREIQPMVQKAHNVDDAVSEASGGIYQAMIEYNNAIQNSNSSRMAALDEMLALYAANFGPNGRPGALQALTDASSTTGLSDEDNSPAGWANYIWSAAALPSGHALISLVRGDMYDQADSNLRSVAAVL